MKSWWEHVPDHKARAVVWSALRNMRRTNGGPFTNREIAEIVADVMELPDDALEVIHTWTPAQCRIFIVRFLVRGLI